MTDKEKVNEFKNKSRKELEKILKDPNSSESDIIIASVEIGHRDIKRGKVYSLEEVIKEFEENRVARIC